MLQLKLEAKNTNLQKIHLQSLLKM